MYAWDDLRYLLEVLRTRSYAAGARELGVNATTVSRRVSELERALGAPLLRRTREGLVATAAGASVKEVAERMEQAAEAARLQALATELGARGAVRLTVSDALGTRFLAPRLGPLLTRHPALELELLIDSALLDLARGEADLALRMARPRQEGLAARKLGAVATGFYASVQYLEAHGVPSPEQRMAGHHVLLRGPRGAQLPEESWAGALAANARPVFYSYSIAAQLGAASAGLGIAALPCYWADSVPELQRIWPDHTLTREVWLAMRADARRVARFRATSDFCAELFARHQPMLLGTLNRLPVVG